MWASMIKMQVVPSGAAQVVAPVEARVFGTMDPCLHQLVAATETMFGVSVFRTEKVSA